MTALDELKTLKQWVLWNFGERDGRTTKVPYRTDGRLASSTDPSTWDTYENVVDSKERNGYDGIGFVVTADDPYCGIDLDHCVVDGVVEDWAMGIVNRYKSYTEITPSGDGLRIWVRGLWAGPWKKINNPVGSTHPRAAIEIYDRGRYFTVTGNQFGG